MANRRSTSFRKRPLGAVAILALAVVVWSGILWKQWRLAPVNRHLDAGIEFLRQGQTGAAESEWRQALALDASNIQAWSLLGDYYIAAKQWRLAYDALLHVLEIDSGTPELQSRLAACAFALNDLKGAQNHAQNALKSNSKDVSAFKVLIEVAKANQDREMYFQHLQTLVSLQPQDEAILIMLATELNSRHEYDKLLPLTERILRLNPVSTEGFYLRAVSLFEKDPTVENLRRCEADLQKVLELDAGKTDAHRYLGRIYMRFNQPRKAVAEFQAISRGRPFASAHFLELSNAYRRAGDASKANEYQQRFFALKEFNGQMTNLKDRIRSDPKNHVRYLDMVSLLLSKIEVSEDKYLLYRYRFQEKNLFGVDYYMQSAMNLRPKDANVKKVAEKLEKAYAGYLQVGLRALAQRDRATSQRNLLRAELLRPQDERTRNALQRAELFHTAPA